ncbi:SdiA-regulated/phytase-like domain-containing protein [Lysobacter tyrosinilyticus]
MSRFRHLTPLLACALLCAAGCSRDAAPATSSGSGSLAGVLLDSQLAEISGLAASRRHRNVLWLHDDGGNPPRLFAVNPDGDRLATVRIEGVTKTDWEDMAAFRLGGRDYLLIADTGDNGGLRRTLQLHAIEEPAQLENARLRPAWSIAFRWPDGARDCEAVAVDERAGQILLFSKKRQPPEVFSLPLRAQSGVQTAQLIGTLAGVPQPTARELRANAKQARIMNQVTAADIAPDGRTLAVMTYRNLLLYPRRNGESWAQAVARAPRVIELPWIPQAEALGWTADGKALYATGEFIPAPLYRIVP